MDRYHVIGTRTRTERCDFNFAAATPEEAEERALTEMRRLPDESWKRPHIATAVVRLTCTATNV